MFGRALALMTLSGLSFSAAAQQAQLVPLDFSPNCISKDGLVVGGDLSGVPYLWSAAEGSRRLLGPSGERLSGKVWAANQDGSVVAGVAVVVTNGVSRTPLFVWSKDSGIQILTSPTQSAQVYGISDDGNVIAFSAGLNGPSIWRRGQGISILPTISGTTSCSLNSISGDGNVAVGTAHINGSPIAARWVLATGVGEVLGHVANGLFVGGLALRTNFDGSVIVGVDGGLGFYWTTNGLVNLGKSTPMGVSADGRFALAEQSVYSLGLGVVSLKTFVEQTYGLDTGGWSPGLETGISGDGNVITGLGSLNGSKGWVLRLPTPPAADFNGDKTLDISDFVDFIDCFNDESVLPPSAADFNNDGFLDVWDFEQFVEAFQS